MQKLFDLHCFMIVFSEQQYKTFLLGSLKNDSSILLHQLIFQYLYNSAEKWPVNIRFPLSLFFGKKEFSHSYRGNTILISSLMSNRNNRKFKITVVWTYKCSFSSVNISRCIVLGYFESPMKSSRTLTVLAFLLQYLWAWLLSSKTSHDIETSKWLLEYRLFSPHST